MTDLDLACACGKIHGNVRGVTPRSGSRLVCYCADCQAYARFLGRDDITDAWGGTDILHFAPAAVRLDRASTLACLRLSDKGLHRWYCIDCKTPIGNTMGRLPFVGLASLTLARGSGRAKHEEAVGPPLGHIHQQSAKGKPPFPEHGLRVISRSGRRMLRWLITGRGAPSPFRNAGVTPRVLTPDERRAL